MDLFKTWLVETPIAHRGYQSKGAPENSIAAFRNAVIKGYAIKLEVQLISDGTVVVFNDDSLSRMTGNDGYLKFLTKDDLPMLYLAGTKETIPNLILILKFLQQKLFQLLLAEHLQLRPSLFVKPLIVE